MIAVNAMPKQIEPQLLTELMQWLAASLYAYRYI